MTPTNEPGNGEEPRVVVRDRRRIDPETGQVRDIPVEAPAAAGTPAGESLVDEAVAPVTELEKELAERTSDLQRLQAEYANYRRRVERDRVAAGLAGKAAVAADLLPLLDDIERADVHGDLNGAFKAVADKLVANLQRAGLEPFGGEGDAFDPSVHEAVQHGTSPDVDRPTVTAVLRRGYRFGERVLRPAMVVVTDHEPAPEPRPEVLVDPAEPVSPPGEQPPDDEY